MIILQQNVTNSIAINNDVGTSSIDLILTATQTLTSYSISIPSASWVNDRYSELEFYVTSSIPAQNYSYYISASNGYQENGLASILPESGSFDNHNYTTYQQATRSSFTIYNPNNSNI